MNGTKRYVVCAVFVIAALSVATASYAQSPFDGTWKTAISQTKWSPKPVVFYISEGWYHCDSCNPAYAVQADGQFHPVANQGFDSASVTIVDEHSISLVTKKGDKITDESTRTVSADGKTLTVKVTDHPMSSDQPVTFEVVAKRSGTIPGGVHAASGNWVIQKEIGSDNAGRTTYKVNGDEMTMTEATGQTYTAKFDGSEAPVTGSYTWTSVSLKKINDHTIEETDKRGDTVLGVSKMTVSANGKTMTTVDTNPTTGRVTTFIATKQ